MYIPPPSANPANIYLFKVNNGKTGAMYEIYLKLTIKTPVRLIEYLLCKTILFTVDWKNIM